MSSTGLSGCPSRCILWIPVRGRASACSHFSSVSLGKGKLEHKYPVKYGELSVKGRTDNFKCAMDASYHGDMTNDQPVIFPRIHVRDLYKRLGISREASEDEIQAARNFLIQQYAGHKPSVDAIESAHDKLIMQKYFEKKNPKVDLKKKARQIKQSRFLQSISSRFKSPPIMILVKTSLAFLVLGVLTVLFPTEEGPTLQVLLSFIATTYFIYDRLRAKFRAFFYGIFAFGFSWLVATFLMVSVVPPLPFIKGVRSFEVTTSLITYVLLWIASGYFK